MSLTVKVIVGMLLGIVVGVSINLSGLNAPGGFVAEFVTGGLFFVVGKLFVNALTMMVVPLVLFSLICGVCGIGDIRLLGKIGSKSFVLYLLTTAVAIATAIAIAGGIGIGEGMQASTVSSFTGRDAPPLTEVLINIVPKNPISAMSKGEMLSVIFFAILFGVSLLLVGRKATKLIEIIEILNETMMKMVTLIMAMAPYAVFCLLAKAMAELGIDLLGQLIGYVLVLVAALLVHLFVTQLFLLKTLSGLSPRIFFKKIRNVQVFAFSTSSSNATIPVTLRTVTERMGVNNSVASFTVPFGATINMDGTAIMQGVATVFIANMYGVDLGLSGYLTVIMMSVLASIGTAGVPGVGLIMLSMVFAQVGLPLEGIGLILGVDRLLDMLRTAVNVSGDAVVSLIVAKSEGQFDSDVYHNENIESADDGHIEVDQQVEEGFAQTIKTVHDTK